jgi:hypothetical protein
MKILALLFLMSLASTFAQDDSYYLKFDSFGKDPKSGEITFTLKLIHSLAQSTEKIQAKLDTPIPGYPEYKISKFYPDGNPYISARIKISEQELPCIVVTHPSGSSNLVLKEYMLKVEKPTNASSESR